MQFSIAEPPVYAVHFKCCLISACISSPVSVLLTTISVNIYLSIYLSIYLFTFLPKPQSVPRIAKCHKNIPLLAEKAEGRQAAAFHWQFLCTLALNLKWNINKISLDQISFESTEIILKKCFSSAENSWKCLLLISWTSLNFLGQFLVPNQFGDNSSLASLTKHVPDAQTLRLYKHSIFNSTAFMNVSPQNITS